jgi:IS1 family transposase
LASCIKLWENIPQQFRQQKSFSDFWAAYNFITEQTQQHELVGKETGQTNHMERWNNTIRQWVGRLTRKTLSFSKTDFFNELVIRLFIIRYNKWKTVN